MSASAMLQPTAGSALPAHLLADLGRAPRRWSRRVAADIVGLLDATAVVAGALLPAAIYVNAGGLAAQWHTILQSALVTALVVCGCLRAWGMYDTNRIHNFPTSPLRLIGALGLGALAVLGLGTPFTQQNAHLWVWYGSWISASFTLLLWNRTLARMALAHFTRCGRFDTRVAVFGAGNIARRVHDYLASGLLGIHFVGVFDDRTGADRLNSDGLTVAGKLDDLIAAGREGLVDQIIIALPAAADHRISIVAAKLEQLPASLHVATHIASDLVDASATHNVSSLGPVGMLDVKHKALSDWGPLLKKIEDYVLGSLLLVVLSPLFLVIAIAIELESGGPLLFRQRRRGLNQKVIDVLKFRTMRVSEDGDGIVQAGENDQRVTFVGRILRRTSLDELPQLINVLRGEMSLVGPRPHALVHDEQWGDILERYANRHQVKPGITGLAQVRGWRGQTETPHKVKMRTESDLAYIRDWSLWLDLKILAMTILAVFGGKNAR